MDDLDLDRRLHEAGAAFRESHTRPAPLAVRRRRRPVLLLPLAAAAVTAGLVLAVTLALPDDTTPPVRPATTSLDLGKADVSDLELGPDALVVSLEPVAAAGKGRLEVRDRSDLRRVLFETTTSYAEGSLACLRLEGDWLAWTDVEKLPGTLVGGGPGQISVWLRNLRTGEQRRLLQQPPSDAAGPAPTPCPVGGAGRLAWNPQEGQLSVLDLATGQVSTSPAAGRVKAVLPQGVLLEQDSRDGLTIALRTDAGDRVVRRVPRGYEVEGYGDRLVWTEKLRDHRPADQEPNEPALVKTCLLPACSQVTQLARDESVYWVTVGSTFSAWTHSAESQGLALFTSGRPPALAPGHVQFRATAAFEDTFAYVTEVGDYPDVRSTLHLLEVG